ncbi:DctQ (C4-dicarboxylate permease, small subunit) [alpha proteobacterium BAL199]|jgi:TRAP-type C4-dicarboxylate transport system permease small subunit|nr:DctQ (C4-dicarboxylate permease, small subunit) [alpha proteobacterium BAL199]
MDRLFTVCGALAAFFLAGICVLVLAQVVGRLMGIAVPSADEFAGYCLSASSFLALGYALRNNSHIRVTLILDRLPANRRRIVEAACVLGGLVLSLFITFYTGEMVYYSLAFGDLTQGLVPIPLWVPQSGMMIGVTVLTLAFLCDGIRVLRGLEPTYLVAARADRQANINQEMI